MRFAEKRKEKRSASKDIVVFYHADCTDGFTAAWVAWKKFGDKADYVAVFYNDRPPKLVNKEIYMLDMCFPKEVVKLLMRSNKRVTAIDHHVSRKEAILTTYKSLYSDKHCGATLAWQYFFPNKPPPKFLLHVEDYDFWRHSLNGTEELYSYLEMFDYTFNIWSKIIKDFEDIHKRKEILRSGRLLLKYQIKIVEYNIKNNARLVKFAGHKVYAINTNYSVSLTGHLLYKKQPPFAIMWYEQGNGLIKVSLRGDKTVDCSRIAAKYKDGGGHIDSAGFYLESLKDIPWTIIK